MKGRIKDFIPSVTGEQYITVIVHENFKERYDELKDTDIDIDIKKWRKKRSLNANDYFWKLCGLLAKKLNITDLEVYHHHIKSVGVKRTETMNTELYKTMSTAWGMLGKGWLTERVDFGKDKDEGLYNFYYGSSVYNTKQMSRLIDSIVEDCKEQGIETLTPQELETMKAAWKNAKK
jgi:hypothetical protein